MPVATPGLGSLSLFSFIPTRSLNSLLLSFPPALVFERRSQARNEAKRFAACHPKPLTTDVSTPCFWLSVFGLLQSCIRLGLVTEINFE